MSGPPPPPPHGGAPKGSGLPPGKYDIFVIPEHSAGAGFLYLPSMQPNVNSFAAGFASALILVAVCQSMAPAFQAWWNGFQGLGNTGISMIVIGVGFGAWSLGRIQQSGSSRKYGPSASWDGSGGYGGTSSRTSANTDGPRPPPHGNSTPPPPPQNDTPPQPPPQQERPKNTWEGTPPQESHPPPKPEPDPEPEPPPRPQHQPQPPPQTPPETPPPKPKQKRPQTPPSTKAEPPKPKESSWEKAREEMRKKEEERKVKEAEQKRRDDTARRLAELRAREAKERQERDKERQRREREAREQEEQRQRLAREQEEQRQRYAQERDEIKQREAKERQNRLEAEKRAKDLAEKLEHERKEREKYEKEAREIREAAAAKAAAEAKAAREAREREDQKQREARELEEKKQREIQEVEDKRKRDALEREERRKRLQKQREEMRRREAEEAARREEAKKKKDEEDLAKKESEAAVREAEAAVRARAEAAANSQAEADERAKTLAKVRAEAEARAKEKAEAEAQAQARKGSSYAYSSVGERTSMWPNGRPPVPKSTTSTSTTSTSKPPPSTAPSSAPTSAPTSAPSNGNRKPPASSASRSNVSSSQTETTAKTEDHSYRPYDKVRARRKKSVSSMTGSESSWAGTHTTSRTSPPPSVRGPYTTNDPDKIVISGVYLFMNQYAKTPASQLISGLGSVTDGLILRITTEGLFIDDDVRGVPQREWDVKAWTLKVTEVWCPPHCLNNPTAAPVPAAKPNPLFKMSSSRPRDRGATKPFTGDEADQYLADMLRSCKDCCQLGLCDRKFRDTNIPSSTGTAGEWKAKGLHVLRATVRDQEGKRYVFVVDETEGWKLAMGLQRLRRGTQVRQLGVSGMAASDSRGTLEMLGWA